MRLGERPDIKSRMFRPRLLNSLLATLSTAILNPERKGLPEYLLGTDVTR